jgi:uncharacterized membrane protein
VNLAAFLGRFHLLLVHFPIAFLILAGLLEVLSRRARFVALRPAVGLLLVSSAVSAVAAAVAGYLLSTSGGYEGTLLAWHKWLGLGVALAAILVSLAWHARHERSLPALQRAYTGILVAAIVLLVVTGHLGASLTRGPGYLTEHMPPAMRSPLAALLGRDEVQASPVQAREAVVYPVLVQPILRARCASCHGSGKAEGGLRLDSAEGLQKGGQHGPVIVAGRAESSELIRRIWLPPAHRDAMPPKGHRPLAVAEAALLRWWVDQGAAFEQTIADVEITADVRPIIETTLGPIEGGGPAILALDVKPADPTAIESVRRLGVSVSPLSDGTSFLEVHCTNVGSRFGDREFEALELLAEQVTWLNLSGTAITDEGLSRVGRFRHVTRLHLDRTSVSDAGLAHLAALEHLEYLNLYGTAVTDDGLRHLSGLNQLRTLYLWQTAATPAAADRLKADLPRVEIDLGVRPAAFESEPGSSPAPADRR